MKAIYLHGFASGPGSRKARFFRDQLTTAGFDVAVPDLAEGDFNNLTITGQLMVAEAFIGKDPVRVIGSSMGGYLAALLAARHPTAVEKLVLLAPALDFVKRWPEIVGKAGMEQWLSTGKLPVFHYAEGRQVDLGLAMFHDSVKWEGERVFSQPALIFHGTRDNVVPVEVSRNLALGRPNVKLVEVDSGHELLDVLPSIWESSQHFLLS